MRRTALILALGLSLPLAAQAQQSKTLPAEQNLDSAGQFRNITATGTTKPPGGGAVSEERLSEPTRKQQAIDRKVQTGICIGCN